MTDLFKKLNVLIKAGIHDLIGGDSSGGSSPHLPSDKLGKGIEREVTLLRGRINEALAYEDELQSRVQALQQEITQWDEKADAAVAGGNDAAARYAIDQMQRAKQHLTIAEADLREHRFVTQELIQKVNMLDAAVADARHSQTESQPSPDRPTEQSSAASPAQLLSDVLRDAREKITQMGELISAQTEVSTPPSSAAPVEEHSIDDDLAERRQRLSKPQ
jgi:phage shock protein A